MEAAKERSCENDRELESMKNDPELDLCSSEFNPLKALYSSIVEVPCPSAEKSQSLDDYECDGSKSKAKEEKVENVEKVKKKILCEDYLIPVHRKRKVDVNVMSRMQDPATGHMEVLHECLQNRIRVRVVIRSFKGIRGICVGFIEAFDKFFNMVLRDVDEIYKIPSKGQRFYHEETVTVSKILEFNSEIQVRKKTMRNNKTRFKNTSKSKQNIQKGFDTTSTQRLQVSDKQLDESSYYSDPGDIDPGECSVEIKDYENDLTDKEEISDNDADENSQGLENMEEELNALREQLNEGASKDSDCEQLVNEGASKDGNCESVYDDGLIGLEDRLALLQKRLDNENDLKVRGSANGNIETHVKGKRNIESKENNEKKSIEGKRDKAKKNIKCDDAPTVTDNESEKKFDTKSNEKGSKQHTKTDMKEKMKKKVNESEDGLGGRSTVEPSINKCFKQLNINSKEKMQDVDNRLELPKKQSTSADATTLRAADQCRKIKLKPEDFRRRHAQQLFIRGDNVVLITVEASLLPEYWNRLGYE